MASKHHGNHYSQVSITKTISVHQKSMHPPHLIALSNLDRQCPLLMYMVFFYKPSFDISNMSINLVFNRLKNGLEETLSDWYPASGRLRVNGSQKLDILCNNDGAVLVEAVTQVKITELGDLSEYNDFFEKLVFKPNFNGDFSSIPLVVAQVTKFGCGGYSIGIGTSHALFDGPATFNFLSAWSSNTKMTKELGDLHGHDEQHKPVHDRGTLLVRNGMKVTKMASAIEHLYQLIQQSFINNHNFGENIANNVVYVHKTFHLSGEMLETLKRKICRSDKKGGRFPCSMFELMATHLWKTRTKALELDNDRMVCLQFAVDTRNKMSPPMPKGFTGNAYVLASIALTVRQLEDESYETIVEKINEAKSSVTNEYINSYINALEAPKGSLPPLDALTIVSDWTRMPFHKVDFIGGEAVYASPLVSPVPQVAYFMQNPEETRGIDVRIGLVPQTLNAFSKYFLADLQ